MSEKFVSIKRKLNQFLFIISDDYCQYWQNLIEMTLSTPNYPKWYHSDGVGCDWLISAPEGFIVALEFNHFNVSNLQKENATKIRAILTSSLILVTCK